MTGIRGTCNGNLESDNRQESSGCSTINRSLKEIFHASNMWLMCWTNTNFVYTTDLIQHEKWMHQNTKMRCVPSIELHKLRIRERTICFASFLLCDRQLRGEHFDRRKLTGSRKYCNLDCVYTSVLGYPRPLGRGTPSGLARDLPLQAVDPLSGGTPFGMGPSVWGATPSQLFVLVQSSKREFSKSTELLVTRKIHRAIYGSKKKKD